MGRNMAAKQGGRPPAIPENLYGVIQGLDLQGRSKPQIQEWLEAQGYRVSVDTVSRLLQKIRICPSADGSDGGLSDLVAARVALREDLISADWRRKHSAARLLLEIHGALLEVIDRRSSRSEDQTPQKAYTTLASPDAWPDPPKSSPDGAGGTP